MGNDRIRMYVVPEDIDERITRSRDAAYGLADRATIEGPLCCTSAVCPGHSINEVVAGLSQPVLATMAAALLRLLGDTRAALAKAAS